MKINHDIKQTMKKVMEKKERKEIVCELRKWEKEKKKEKRYIMAEIKKR